LEEIRNPADLIEVFIMIKGLAATPWSSFFDIAANSLTTGHSWKFVKKSCRSDTRLYFFSQGVVNRWNSLSQAELMRRQSTHSRISSRKYVNGRWTSSKT